MRFREREREREREMRMYVCMYDREGVFIHTYVQTLIHVLSR